MSMRVIILKVRVNIFVLDIPEVQDHSARFNTCFERVKQRNKQICRNGMEVTIDFYFRQYWSDHRLLMDPKVSTLLLNSPVWKDNNRESPFQRLW